jgi:hypothetical protein
MGAVEPGPADNHEAESLVSSGPRRDTLTRSVGEAELSPVPRRR